MGASMKIDISALKRIAAKFDSPQLRDTVTRLPQEKAVAALVGQAIADNFDQEGPGWAPLKPATIRASVGRKIKKSMGEMTDEELLKHERIARKGWKGADSNPFRRILQKTGLLKKTATMPGFTGSKGGKTGSNIWKTEGSRLIWGTDLIYAGVHQRGNAKRKIPARPVLTLRPVWLKQIQDYVVQRAFKVMAETFVRGGR